jgi:phospholipid-binding lipoprotein MlaA
MGAGRSTRRGAIWAAAILLVGIASAMPAQRVAAAEAEVDDPIEPANRAVFGANSFLDRHVLKPMAGGYRETAPGVLQRGLSNVLGNLKEPSVAVNDLLQGNPARALSTVWRFAVNSTAGGLGVFDIAADLGLDRHEADFGQTLGVWGVGNGPYLTLPLLGPSTVRDAAGTVVGTVLNPLSLGPAQPVVTVGQALDQRVQAHEALETLERSSVDFYATLRSAYVQRRQALVIDGKTPGSLATDAAAPAILLDDAPAIETEAAPRPVLPMVRNP